MRRGGAGLIAAVLALAGCKGTDPKPADKKAVPGAAASRPKGQTPEWLDGAMAKLPSAGTGVPKADSWANPRDPNFSVANEVKGVLAGRVLDPLGRGAKSVFIRIEPVDVAPGAKGGAAVGIQTDAAGFFMAKGLKPGQTYTLTAEAQVENKPLFGMVQARTPQSNLTIALRDDLAPPTGGLPPPAPGATATGPTAPPGSPTAGLPPAAEFIPPTPMGVAPPPAPTRPTDGGWAPGTGAATSPIPATLAPTTPTPTPAPTPPAPTPAPAPVPPPVDVQPATPPRPENLADGPPPFRPPAASIPGPPVPALPLPPATTPAPPVIPAPEKKSSRPVRAGANFALVDTLERPWDFATNREGSLVLLDFMTTTCVPCKRYIPTLIDVQSRYAGNGLQLVGVVCDEVPQKERAALATKYQRDHGLNYALYVEPGPEPGGVRDRFGVQSYPTVILLDGEGNAVWKGHPGKRDELESAIRRQLGK
jgi:thiol-disulfide isomerase/thioredoxin